MHMHVSLLSDSQCSLWEGPGGEDEPSTSSMLPSERELSVVCSSEFHSAGRVVTLASALLKTVMGKQEVTLGTSLLTLQRK